MSGIYLDSCLIITLTEGSEQARALLSQCLTPQTIYSIQLARLESRILAIRLNNRENLQKFDRFVAGCKMIAMNREVFEQAIFLRISSKLKTPDFLHLAAMVAGCQVFWTDEKQLKTVARTHHLTVVDWEALERQASCNSDPDSEEQCRSSRKVFDIRCVTSIQEALLETP